MIILNKLSAPYEQCHWLILHEVSVPVSQMFGCWAGAKDDQGGKLKTPCVSLNLVSCYSDLLSYLCCVGAFVSVLSKAEMVSSTNHQAETTGQRPRIHSEGRCTRSDTVTGSPVSRSGECLCIDTYIIMLVHPKIQFFSSFIYSSSCCAKPVSCCFLCGAQDILKCFCPCVKISLPLSFIANKYLMLCHLNEKNKQKPITVMTFIRSDNFFLLQWIFFAYV